MSYNKHRPYTFSTYKAKKFESGDSYGLDKLKIKRCNIFITKTRKETLK